MSRALQRNALLIQHCYIPYGTTQLEKTIKKRQKGPVWPPKDPFGGPWGTRRATGCQKGPISGQSVWWTWVQPRRTNPGQLGPNLVSRGPPRAPKGPFWAKMGPFRVPVDPEGVRYQVKVCGDHESNQEELIEGSWDQIWPPGALQGPPGPPKGSFGPFWGRNEPFWGPQEYRRGPLRGQSWWYGCYPPSWTSQWQLRPNQGPWAFRGPPGPSEDLWGPQKGLFGPLGVLVWPQSGPKCHIIMCYVRGKCFSAIWDLSWQHLVRSSFYPSGHVSRTKNLNFGTLKNFQWMTLPIIFWHHYWPKRLLFVRF